MEKEWFGEEYDPQESPWVRIFEHWNNRRTLGRIVSFSLTGRRLLEIGVGSGSFMEFAKSRGFQVMGCDLSVSICRHVERKFHIPVHHGHVDTLPDVSAYDVVVMNHVLEHVSDPVGLLQEVRRRMNRGGVLHVAVPNLDSWEATQGKDEQFGVAFAWDIPLLDGYENEFLVNRSKNPGPQSSNGLYNPDADRKILDFRPDAVLVHGYSSWTSRFIINRMFHHDVPLIFRGESNLLQPRPLHVRIVKEIYLRYLFGKISAFASIGQFNTEYYRHYGAPGDKIFFSPYSVDNDFFQSRTVEARLEAEVLRKDLGIIDKTVILFSAKFISKKQPLELIEGFHRSGISRNCVLVFAGDGEMKPLMEKRIADLGIATSVRFLGFRNQSQMPATYALGDLFVIPSSIEPWGLAVNEAMNLGLPIIASDMVGSARDLIRHGENGWVYPSSSVDNLAACLSEAASLGREGLRVKGKSSLEIIARWGIPETVSGILDALGSVT